MKRPQPLTAGEVQALTVIDAAAAVAASLEAQRRALAREPRRRYKAALMEAAERLVNLVSLAAERMSDDVGHEVRSHVIGRLGELRERLLATSFGLVGERADTIIRRARAVDGQRREYPLGLAAKLAAALSSIEQAVEAMGGSGQLDGDLRAKVVEAREAVSRLKEIEAETELQEL